MNDKTLISINNVSKSYGNTLALDKLNLDIKYGEVHAVVGENGAGKSTLIKILSGYTTADAGSITVMGKAFFSMTPQRAIELGISTVYQAEDMIAELSVAENIFLGTYEGNGFIINRKKMEKESAKALENLGLKINPKTLVKNLSPSSVQLCQIVKAIIKKSKLLILDEPTASLTNSEALKLFALIKKLKESGISTIYISHRLEEIFAIADRVSILRDGKLIKSSPISHIDKNSLIYSMVGRSIGETFPERKCTSDTDVLRVENLKAKGLYDINFELKKSEILGIGGLMGAGRSRLGRTLIGDEQKTDGSVLIGDKVVKIDSPKKAIKYGIAYSPEDRRKCGLMMQRSIRENITLSSLRKISKAFFIKNKKEEQIVKKYKDSLNIKTPSCKLNCETLSGGNQQKVVLSKLLASNANIIILDEPTQGIDVGAKYELYQMMNRMTKDGKAIILISSDIEELMGMSDRILVLCKGRQAGILSRDKGYEQNKILSLASGQ